MQSRFAIKWGAGGILSSASSAAAIAAMSLGLAWPASIAISTLAEAKTPGKSYCFYGRCHRVMTLEETRRAVGKRIVLKASHYDGAGKDRYNPSNLTASGEWFRPDAADNAASPKLPNGTVILAWNPATRQSAVLRINNAGPYWGDRQLDVSRGAAERLGFARQGVATLHIQIIQAATPQDVAYRKGRRYAPVPGHIGQHGSFDLAAADAARRLGGQNLPAPSVVASAAPQVEQPAASQLDLVVAGGPKLQAIPEQSSTEVTLELASAPGGSVALALATPPPAPSEPVLPEITTAAITVPDTQPQASPAAARTPVVAVAPAARKRVAAQPARKVAEATQLKRAPSQVRVAAISERNVATVLANAPAARRPQRLAKSSVAEVVSARPQQRQQQQLQQQRIQTASRQQPARNIALDDDDDDDDEVQARPARRLRVASLQGQRRTSGQTPSMSRQLPAECRDGSRSCEVTVSASGSAAGVRSWASASKRQ